MTARCPRIWPPTRASRSSPTKSRRSRKPSTNRKVTARAKDARRAGGRAVNASRQGWRSARGAFGGSSQAADQTLPAGEPLALEEQNAALAARPPHRPEPRCAASKPVSSRLSLHDVVVPALQRRVSRRSAAPLALRSALPCPRAKNGHGRASPAMTKLKSL